MLGVGLADGVDARSVVATMLDRGLIANAVDGSTVRLVPPLTVTPAEIDEAVAIIAGVLTEHADAAGAAGDAVSRFAGPA